MNLQHIDYFRKEIAIHFKVSRPHTTLALILVSVSNKEFLVDKAFFLGAWKFQGIIKAQLWLSHLKRPKPGMHQREHVVKGFKCIGLVVEHELARLVEKFEQLQSNLVGIKNWQHFYLQRRRCFKSLRKKVLERVDKRLEHAAATFSRHVDQLLQVQTKRWKLPQGLQIDIQKAIVVAMFVLDTKLAAKQ